MKSAILSSRREITPLLSDDGDSTIFKPYFEQREKRILTEGDVSEFKIFPNIKRSSSKPVLEEQEEEEDITHTE